MTEDDLYERLSDMGFVPESDLSHLHYYLLPALPALDTPEGGEAVLSIARRHDAGLIIIDTTSRVLTGKKNDADTLRAFYQWTGLPLKADGRTVWRLDHSGKDMGKGQRGTSAKNDDVDLVWELTAREGGGLRLRATYRRQSWVPEVVDLVKLEDPLRHERAAESWPVGTVELAKLLDQLEIPLGHGNTLTRRVLKEHGKGARNEVIAAAIRYRKQQADMPREPGNGPGNASHDSSGNSGRERSSFSFGDTPGELSGTVAAADGVPSPSLEGEHQPDEPSHVPPPSQPREPCRGGCGRDVPAGQMCSVCATARTEEQTRRPRRTTK